MKLKSTLIALLLTCLNFINAQNYRYTIYNTQTSNLPQNQITSLFQDRKGNIWVGTKFGVAKFDGENFKVYGREYGLVVGDISHIFETKLGEILLCSSAGGITTIISNKIKSVHKPEFLSIIAFAQIKDSIVIYETSKNKVGQCMLLSFKKENFNKLKEFQFKIEGFRYSNDTIWIFNKNFRISFDPYVINLCQS